MSNLLPPEGKSIAKHEYYLRVFAVWAFGTALGLVSFALFLLPTFLLVHVERESASAAGKSDDAERARYEEATAQIARANAVAGILKEQATAKPSEAIAELRAEATEAIRLTGIEYIPDGKGVTMNVRGVARTREALSGFVAALKRNPYFSDAAVPVSDYAKNEDAPFSATVRITTE